MAKHRGRYVVRTDGEWIGYVECSDGTVRKASKEIGYNFTLDLEKKDLPITAVIRQVNEKTFKLSIRWLEEGNRIMNEQYARDMEELKQAGQPLVDLIRKKYTPMTTVIVTGAFVELLSTEVGVKPDDD